MWRVSGLCHGTINLSRVLLAVATWCFVLLWWWPISVVWVKVGASGEEESDGYTGDMRFLFLTPRWRVAERRTALESCRFAIGQHSWRCLRKALWIHRLSDTEGSWTSSFLLILCFTCLCHLFMYCVWVYDFSAHTVVWYVFSLCPEQTSKQSRVLQLSCVLLCPALGSKCLPDTRRYHSLNTLHVNLLYTQMPKCMDTLQNYHHNTCLNRINRAWFKLTQFHTYEYIYL